MMHEIELPSGATLRVALAPFAESKAVFQALLEEMKSVNVSVDVDVAAFFKEAFCYALSSQRIEKLVQKLLAKCTIDDMKIDDATFEPQERRQDYVKVFTEVVKLNTSPFLKSLYADFKLAATTLQGILTFTSLKMTSLSTSDSAKQDTPAPS